MIPCCRETVPKFADLLQHFPSKQCSKRNYYGKWYETKPKTTLRSRCELQGRSDQKKGRGHCVWPS